jgi:hypothetical protein
VRLSVLFWRRRNADNHRPALEDLSEIAACSKSPQGNFLRYTRRRNVMDEAFPPIELLYLRKVNIQANDRHSFAAKLEA